MDVLTSHRFQSAADSSSGIVFKPDIFDCDLVQTQNGSETQERSLLVTGKQEVLRGQIPKIPTTSAGTSTENRHVNFEIPQMKRRQSPTHPAFRRRPGSGRAGNITPLDDQIARSGGTTSTYEQLPHQLQIAKQPHAVSSAERVVELTRANGYLLQKLAYYKDIQVADMDFYKTVMELHAKLGDALKKRSQKLSDAELTLLRSWNINSSDRNIEDTVFRQFVKVCSAGCLFIGYDIQITFPRVTYHPQGDQT